MKGAESEGPMNKLLQQKILALSLDAYEHHSSVAAWEVLKKLANADHVDEGTMIELFVVFADNDLNPQNLQAKISALRPASPAP